MGLLGDILAVPFEIIEGTAEVVGEVAGAIAEGLEDL